MNSNKRKRRNKLLPHFLFDFIRFLFAYKVLRLYDRMKVIGHVLLRWVLAFYVPFYLWLLARLVSSYWTASAGPFDLIKPAWLGYLPTPFFSPVSGNALNWLFVLLLGVLWTMAGVAMLNGLTERVINAERIEERWRKACLHVGLVTETNLTGEDVKEFPPVISASDKVLIIEGKGYTPEKIRERRAEISSAMGVFVGDVSFARKKDGSTYPNLLEVSYFPTDLPSLVPLQRVPVSGNVVFGLSKKGWQNFNLEELVHVGVCGLTGSGKSVWLRSFMTQVFVVNPEACIVGIDFKGGAEFAFFDKLGRNFVLIMEHENAALVLAELFAEYQRRAALLANSTCESVQQLPGIASVIVVIDESAEFFDSSLVDKKTFERSTFYIDKLARLGRAAGIHLVVCTQRPTSTDGAIPPRIRSMLATRVVFRVEQKEDSIAFLGNAQATKLAEVPGRFLLKNGGELVECQAPYVSKAEAKEILAKLPAMNGSELVSRLKRVSWQGRERMAVAV